MTRDTAVVDNLLLASVDALELAGFTIDVVADRFKHLFLGAEGHNGDDTEVDDALREKKKREALIRKLRSQKPQRTNDYGFKAGQRVRIDKFFKASARPPFYRRVHNSGEEPNGIVVGTTRMYVWVLQDGNDEPIQKAGTSLTLIQ